MSSERLAELAVFMKLSVIMLQRAMTIVIETFRAMFPHSDRFDRLMAIGWEDVGGVVLAMSAFAFMTAVAALRSR